jgi:hypothetical protein
MLYKKFNDQQPPVGWMQSNFNQAISRKQQLFECNDQSNYNIVVLCGRLCFLDIEL